MRGDLPVSDRHQGLGAASDDAELLQDEQVHVRAGVGGAQYPIDVQRVSVGGDLEALGHHHLKGLAGPDGLLGRLDGGMVLLRAAAAHELGCRPAEHRRAGRRRCAQLRDHPVQPGHRVVVGLIDAIGGIVPVDRVSDQRDGALVVVHGGEIGGQQHHQFGHP